MSKIPVNFLFTFILFINTSCHGQESNTATTMKKQTNRQPVVSGRFYPSYPEELRKSIASYLQEGEKGTNTQLTLAIIAPHAGYIFSGPVAASAFNQLHPEKAYEHVFIIASSHQAYFSGASIYHIGNYITPLGEISVDTVVSNELLKQNSLFAYHREAHDKEHSIEVQLPFLQYCLKKPFTIIPIVLGTNSPDEIKSIATTLKPWFNEKNLFVISSDFSHYPDYADANKIDSQSVAIIQQNNPQALVDYIAKKKQSPVQGLSTKMCGWSSILTLLNMIDDKKHATTLVDYKNSGDSRFGDKERVVGYAAIKVSVNNSESFSLTDEDKEMLFSIAREAIKSRLNRKYQPKIPEEKALSPSLLINSGAFVTLHIQKKLRGCIGRFTSNEPLYKVVYNMAMAAAFEDPRFHALSEEEYPSIDIEISVLSPMKLIDSIGQIELGKHGIYIKKGYQSGTFLPQVATETGWDLEQFLGHCAQDKAGIGWYGWKEAEIYIYEALVFSEKKE